jgi:hypothetical protein
MFSIHPFFQPNHGDPAPLKPLGINHVHRSTHAPPVAASVNQGVSILMSLSPQKRCLTPSDPKEYTSYMLTHKLQNSPGSHFARVDSGTPIHVVFDHPFVSNTKEDHTPVAGFSGSASRYTQGRSYYKGTHPPQRVHHPRRRKFHPCGARLRARSLLSETGRQSTRDTELS